MTLNQLLEITNKSTIVKQGISEERITACLPTLREKISFYRQYPDIFVDQMKGPDSVFKFRFSQRLFLRAIMRHRYVYATFPRGFSKSFITVMALMLRAILFPGSHLFVTTGGKQQAALITISKVEEICKLLPCLNNEINWARGVSKKSRDEVNYVFKNGSTIDILAARQSSRGQRRTGGVIQQVILVDGDALNEIIIPTTNVDRLLPDGTYDRDEVVNQSLVYITTAGWKQSFSYAKLLQILINSVIFPDQYMILGGDYELAILEGAVKQDMVEQLKLNGTYNQSSFDREYNSIWSGDALNAFYSAEQFDKCRQLLQPEKEYSGRTSKSSYYILGVDVGRFKCTTQVCVFKVIPQVQGASLKSLVNLYSYEATDFEEQAINVKKIFYKYKARTVAIDANGVGAGFVDFMTKAQVDPETGDTLPAFGVCGGTSQQAVAPYKKLKGEDVEKDAMYLIKATAPINTQCYSYVKVQMSSGKIKMLIDERQASAKLMDTKVGQNMVPQERAEYLSPYVKTSVLKEQMLNLVQDNEGVNIILKQNNKSVPKDRFSSFMYGLYYIKQDQQSRRKKRSRNMSDFLFFNSGQ